MVLAGREGWRAIRAILVRLAKNHPGSKVGMRSRVRGHHDRVGIGYRPAVFVCNLGGQKTSVTADNDAERQIADSASGP